MFNYFISPLKNIWRLLYSFFSRRTEREIFYDDYLKTNDDVLKMHDAVMRLQKTKEDQKVKFSNGETTNFSYENVKFDWSKCRT